jgi:hypothetical protein
MAYKLVTVSVTVPEITVDSLYSYVAELHRAAREGTSAPRPVSASPKPDGLPAWTIDDVELYRTKVWKRLTRTAQQTFKAIALAPPGTRFSGDALAKAIDLGTGRHGVAGILSKPGSYCREAGRDLFWSFEPIPDTGTYKYWLDEVQVELVRRMD